MVDPARRIPATRGVDDASIVQFEQERVIRIVGIAIRQLVGFLRRHATAKVFDDVLTLADRARRENAAPVNR